MLLNQHESALLLIDVQEKLTPLVQGSESLVENCAWLMRLARECEVPILTTEQYPQGLGPTVSALNELNDNKASKVAFSCVADENSHAHIQALNKKQLVLCGIETSVCVLQTAIDMIEDYHVFVVADCVSGRHQKDHELALQRMANYGVDIITKEMVFFEWLRVAGTEKFKHLSKSFLQ